MTLEQQIKTIIEDCVRFCQPVDETVSRVILCVEAEINLLSKKADELERDREYNAELVREREAEIVRLNKKLNNINEMIKELPMNWMEFEKIDEK